MSFLKELFSDNNEPKIEFNSTLFNENIFGSEYLIVLKGLYDTKTRKLEEPSSEKPFRILLQTGQRLILHTIEISSREEFCDLFLVPINFDDKISIDFLREIGKVVNKNKLIDMFSGIELELNPFSYQGTIKLMFSNVNVAVINYKIDEGLLDTNIPINDRIIYENSYNEIPLNDMEEFDFNITETFRYVRGKESDSQLDELIDNGYIIQDENDSSLYYINCVYYLDGVDEESNYSINEDTIFVALNTERV